MLTKNKQDSFHLGNPAWNLGRKCGYYAKFEHWMEHQRHRIRPGFHLIIWPWECLWTLLNLSFLTVKWQWLLMFPFDFNHVKGSSETGIWQTLWDQSQLQICCVSFQTSRGNTKEIVACLQWHCFSFSAISSLPAFLLCTSCCFSLIWFKRLEKASHILQRIPLRVIEDKPFFLWSPSKSLSPAVNLLFTESYQLNFFLLLVYT